MIRSISQTHCLLLAAALLAPFASVRSAEDVDLHIPRTETISDVTSDSVLNSRVAKLEKELKGTRGTLMRLQSEVAGLKTKNVALQNRLTGLDTSVSVVQTNASSLQADAQQIKADLSNTGVALDGKIATVDQRTGHQWLLTLLMVGLLIAILGFGYWALQRFFGNRIGAVDAELDRVNTDVQAKLIKVDAQLVSSLEKLLQVKPVTTPAQASAEVDHGLALKVADEVTRIEQNLAQMDPTVKGHKQLTAATKRLQENLQAAGYELPQFLGKMFDERMKVTAAFIPDEKLQQDERIITRVFRPTVLHEGKTIQIGDIQVSHG